METSKFVVSATFSGGWLGGAVGNGLTHIIDYDNMSD